MKDIRVDVIGQTEDALQQKCVFWFWNTFPEKRGLLFSVPNGGTRNKREAAKMKQTGLTPGVADLLLMINGVTYCLELKIQGGRQSKTQKDWQMVVEKEGFFYDVIWSLEEFKYIVNRIMIENGKD